MAVVAGDYGGGFQPATPFVFSITLRQHPPGVPPLVDERPITTTVVYGGVVTRQKDKEKGRGGMVMTAAPPSRQRWSFCFLGKLPAGGSGSHGGDSELGLVFQFLIWFWLGLQRYNNRVSLF
uniref:Uncharacterized protein n=1 Tax=Helianthus annuus TaxID=4232 RepID=A0A251RYC1_HELAN